MMGTNVESIDVPPVSHPDILGQEVFDNPSGLKYTLPSVSGHSYSNPIRPSTTEAPPGNTKSHSFPSVKLAASKFITQQSSGVKYGISSGLGLQLITLAGSTSKGSKI